MTDQRERFELLVLDELRKMNAKLDEIIKNDGVILRQIHGSRKPTEEPVKFEGALDVMTLLSLPDNLRKTAMVMSRLSEATAQDVARETERKRAVESALLNQLTRMGHLYKQRRGRKVYFIVE